MARKRTIAFSIPAFLEAGFDDPVEAGVYVKLLLRAAADGSLPAKRSELIKIAGCTDEVWEAMKTRLSSQFTATGDRLVSKLLHPALSNNASHEIVTREVGEGVLAAWREILHDLPEPQLLDDGRLAALRARTAEASKTKTRAFPDGFKDADGALRWWRSMFKFMRDSDFLMGRKTDFVADFDFVMQAASFRNIFEGKYHRKRK